MANSVVQDDTWAPLRAIAAARPGAACLEDRHGVVTFGQFAARVEAIAKALRAEQTSGRVAALFLERDRDLPAAMFAAHSTGAAYLPIVASQPEARLRLILEDARCAFTVTTRALADRLPPGGRMLFLDDLSWHGSAGTETRRIPDGCAYLMYTSGSTGRPKGVLIGHTALTNFHAAADADFAEPAQQVWLAQSSEGYDVSLPELIWALTRGHYVCLSGADPLSIMRSALSTGTRDGRPVSHIVATPSLARFLSEHPQASQGLRRLHTLAFCGEPFPTDLIPRLLADVPEPPRVANRYGPTEATVWVAGADYLGPDSPATEVRVITPHTTARVLDEHLREVPVGGTGRLFLGGRQLALGYLRPDGLSQERFHTGPAGREYDTGDLARVDSDVSFTVLGRDDGQIKIAGHRVELGEIEAVMRRCPGVRDAICLPDAVPATSIAALVSGSEPLASDDIRTWLRRRLPAHMVPARIDIVDHLPLTPSGKIDRLRATEFLRPASSGRAE
ncbi:amino acid adenylation domain-containing protein [Dactylosporangium roseum]|uniref:Amino acid adenylation domain-containing protein n=1 Tax=Dactylosporangium roseum TaxID=47989 RepID=A0ABY5Z646_9ACTN|nr:amino acid adenylation domain-containing protein [Dactylosporangium roseum]UWZ36198.1 amino acid adenylation domain-containing protein [Dactylosporangium roseum]